MHDHHLSAVIAEAAARLARAHPILSEAEIGERIADQVHAAHRHDDDLAAIPIHRNADAQLRRDRTTNAVLLSLDATTPFTDTIHLHEHSAIAPMLATGLDRRRMLADLAMRLQVDTTGITLSACRTVDDLVDAVDALRHMDVPSHA